MAESERAEEEAPRCENCRHWKSDRYLHADMGRCRRFPPGWFMSVEFVNKGDSTKQVYVSQPVAMSHDMCGEHALKPVESSPGDGSPQAGAE